MTDLSWLRRRVPAPVKDQLRRLRRRRKRVVPPPPGVDLSSLRSRPDPGRSGIRLYIGPANFAGQGWAWARAAERNLADVTSINFAFEKGAMDFPTDYSVPVPVYRWLPWQREQEAYLSGGFTHVLIEALRPVLGPLYAGDCSGEIPVLQGHGLSVALLAHGSEIRSPRRHARSHAFSPFSDPTDDFTQRLQAQADRLGAIFNSFEGPRFVSTPDLLDDAPGATWLPVVVDPQVWGVEDREPRSSVPVVVHAPSSDHMKGSDVVDPVAASLAAEGLIEYRRISGVDPYEMPAVYAQADVVLDQFRLGSYGVAACEAMAGGRVVVGHVTEQNRERVQHTGHQLPIVEATPQTLEQVLRELVADAGRRTEIGEQGRRFVSEVHDGRRAAEVLAGFLGARPAEA